MNAKKASTKFDSKAESNAIAAIKQLPAKPPEQLKSAREVISGMAELIRSRIASGYTYQQIVDTLANAGIVVSVGTLRAYLSAAGQSSRKSVRDNKAVKVTSEVERKSNDNAAQAKPTSVYKQQSAFQDPDEK